MILKKFLTRIEVQIELQSPWFEPQLEGDNTILYHSDILTSSEDDPQLEPRLNFTVYCKVEESSMRMSMTSSLDFRTKKTEHPVQD